MARASRSNLCALLVASLLVNAFCVPAGRPGAYRNRPYRDDLDGETFDNDQQASASQTSSTTVSSLNADDDDDDFGEPLQYPQSGGGSNIISLLNLATALFPSSSSGVSNRAIRNVIRQYLLRRQQPIEIRRQDIADNVIEIDYVQGLTPPFQRQEDEDEGESDESNGDDDDESESEEHNDAAEESIENNKVEENGKSSKQDSNGDSGGKGDDGDNESDYSEEPEGDGQGGGILGLLAGLSGGEDGSDLGTLLATVSQIVGNLSGDGFDLNALLASAFGLFVGLLSEGEENPGTVIASYLLTSLDTITGGGAKNNGAFFGKFLSALVKGTSAVESGSDEDSEENGNGKMKMSDSTGFFVSLLMSLSGDMSKSSSGGSSHPW